MGLSGTVARGPFFRVYVRYARGQQHVARCTLANTDPRAINHCHPRALRHGRRYAKAARRRVARREAGRGGCEREANEGREEAAGPVSVFRLLYRCRFEREKERDASLSIERDSEVFLRRSNRYTAGTCHFVSR